MFGRLTRLLAVAAVSVGAVALPATAGAKAKTKAAALPVTASLPSSDPTKLREDASATVKRTASASVSAVRVTLAKGGRTYASGTLKGALPRSATAVPLTFARTPTKGSYTLTVSARKGGKRTSTARTVALTTPSLPLRAAPVSTLAGDNAGGVRFVVRSVAGQKVRNVRAALVSSSGATVASALANTVDGQAVVDLPLSGTLAAGTYTLKLTGSAPGTSSTTSQTLVFKSGSSGGGSVVDPAKTSGGAVVQHVVVDWSDGKYQGADTAGFVAPGIGHGELVCRPDAQWIRFYPNDQAREVSMMNWTYRDWQENQEKALREALHTQYTGADFREGFNKFTPTEKHSTGQFDGLITDRGVIGAPFGANLASPTSLHLTWVWDMSSSGHERCHVEATFTTDGPGTTTPVARSAQVVWRGDANAAGHDTATTTVPGLGTVTVLCQPGDGNRTITIDTPQGATVTTRQASEDNAVGQQIGPVVAQLPNNGQLSIALADGQTALVSSRWKTNDPDPTQNWCAVAAQVIAP
jgi:hypothetical protein